ncbi:MAG: hypothetical protein JJ931_01455 [Henriciella sp.]|nr:hypothetical protein [Henriciella sp.]MBO6694066.1 hypothetical protein [Henriciella sp.]
MKLAIYILRFAFAFVVITLVVKLLNFAVISSSGFYSNYSGSPRDYSFVPRAFLGSFVYLSGILITYSAIVDLTAIPERAIERFRFRSLGWLGICGLALYLMVLIWLLEAITQVYSFIQSDVLALNSSLFWLSATLNNSLPYVLIGALCFYLRYRIAANRRLASAHKP